MIIELKKNKIKEESEKKWYSGEKTKTAFLKNISTYCLLQFIYIYIQFYIYIQKLKTQKLDVLE